LKQLIKTDPTLLSELSPALKKYCLLDEANPSQSPISSSSSEQVLKQVAYFKDWIFEHSLSDAELCEQELL